MFNLIALPAYVALLAPGFAYAAAEKVDDWTDLQVFFYLARVENLSRVMNASMVSTKILKSRSFERIKRAELPTYFLLNLSFSSLDSFVPSTSFSLSHFYFFLPDRLFAPPQRREGLKPRRRRGHRDHSPLEAAAAVRRREARPQAGLAWKSVVLGMRVN